MILCWTFSCACVVCFSCFWLCGFWFSFDPSLSRLLFSLLFIVFMCCFFSNCNELLHFPVYYLHNTQWQWMQCFFYTSSSSVTTVLPLRMRGATNDHHNHCSNAETIFLSFSFFVATRKNVRCHYACRNITI